MCAQRRAVQVYREGACALGKGLCSGMAFCLHVLMQRKDCEGRGRGAVCENADGKVGVRGWGWGVCKDGEKGIIYR